MSLEIIIGGMFCGKTTELLHRFSRDVVIKRSILYITHSFDKERIIEGKDFFTHNPFFTMQTLLMVTVLVTDTLPSSDMIKDYDTIGIDEAQFFTSLLPIDEYVDVLGKRVILAGLSGDYERKTFGNGFGNNILDWIPKANRVDLLSANCNFCAEDKRTEPAYFTFRVSSEKDQIVVGGSDKYKAVCRKHYNQLTATS